MKIVSCRWLLAGRKKELLKMPIPITTTVRLRITDKDAEASKDIDLPPQEK
jgi:hypothetical protein